MTRTALTLTRADAGADDCIRFLLDGVVHQIDDVAPTRSVLNYLRENLRRTGTKEGCAEGDCGACTVVVAELDAGNALRTRTVNACLQLVPFLDGKALFTVESLKTPNPDPAQSLHPVQQAMVDCHGSQCGFCTPGFVMSLFGLYLDHVRDGSTAIPDDRTIRTSIAGNLCRCTGYRPIIDAAKRMFDLPQVRFDRDGVAGQLQSIRRERSLDYAADGFRFSAPRTLAELHDLRARFPQATLVAGNTDVGLWINKQLREIPHLIGIAEVAELKLIAKSGSMLRIGAAVPLEDAYAALASYYPELVEMWERFASPPIRNAGTMGGNVANGSPIGDSMPALIVLGALVVLSGIGGERTIPLEELYVGYQKKSMLADEIVEAIEVPLPAQALRFRTYKVSKRYDSDISAVCAGFAIHLDAESGRIAECRIAYGGMAATPRRASNAEAALRGAQWDEAALRSAMRALAQDFEPLSDLRASSAYRLRVAQNLLERFHLETRAGNPLADTEVSVFAAA